MKLIKCFCLILTLITLGNCKDNEPKDLEITSFPMSIGTSWTYEDMSITSYIKLVGLDSIVTSDTLKF